MKRVMILTMLIACLLHSNTSAGEFKRSIATAYCLKGTTATGVELDGSYKRVVASKREYFGKIMAVWIDEGDHIPKADNFLGLYEVADTGSESIRNGKVIDIYLPTYEECMEFGAKDIIYLVYESEG